MVTSAASAGFLSKPKKEPALALLALYSGNTLPACRISQTGLREVSCPFAACKIKSFRYAFMVAKNTLSIGFSIGS